MAEINSDTLTLPPYWHEAKACLTKQDPIMGKIITHYHGHEGMRSRGDALQTLLRSIVGQQISVKAADAVWGRFHALYPNGTVTAAATVTFSPEALRGVGLSRQKVKYVLGTAEAFLTGTVHPKAWENWDDEDIIKELIQLPGIGRWTAEMFLMFYLLRPDVLPVADLGIQKGYEQHYGQPWKPNLTEHAKIWQPYRSVACWYLWRSLDPVPVAY